MRSIRVAILTCSDQGSQGLREDRSGDLVQAWAEERDYVLVARDLVPDESSEIVPRLLAWCDGGEVDVVVCTGGTGFGPRDGTTEAARAVIQRGADGLAEAIRRAGEASTPFAPLSRGVAGIRGRTLLLTLPGSPGGVRDGLAVLTPLLDHLVAILRGEESEHRPTESEHGPPQPEFVSTRPERTDS